MQACSFPSGFLALQLFHPLLVGHDVGLPEPPDFFLGGVFHLLLFRPLLPGSPGLHPGVIVVQDALDQRIVFGQGAELEPEIEPY